MEISLQQLSTMETELRAAMAAKKCWRCGCFQNTVNALQSSAVISAGLGTLLTEAQNLFKSKRYDCLGCNECWPAEAQNVAAELDPAIAEGNHCATQTAEIRQGWPPLPGNYRVIRFKAPVAVCTLNSDQLMKELAITNKLELSIVGGLHTENLGIEHLLRNVLANPHIRFLIVCGEDSRKAIGHLPGQSLIALIENGVNDKMHIIDARGKRPVLNNVTHAQVVAFRKQVQVIDQIGNCNLPPLLELIAASAKNDPGPFAETPAEVASVAIEVAKEPGKLILDPTGYFVVYPDRVHRCLTLEHYSNKGVLDRIFTASSATNLYTSVIDAQLISRLDHAAYLGRELARAEQALLSGEDYVQDRAPGELEQSNRTNSGPKASACGCRPGKGKS